MVYRSHIPLILIGTPSIKQSTRAVIYFYKHLLLERAIVISHSNTRPVFDKCLLHESKISKSIAGQNYKKEDNTSRFRRPISTE